jgi:hypothetical protein
MGKPNASVLVLKDLQASMAEKNKLAWFGYSSKKVKLGNPFSHRKKQLGWSCGKH